MERFDLMILGGGPAGYCAAERAGAMGKAVLLIEKASLGGVCLNEGCIPSKTLLHSAKVLSYAQHGQPYGVSAENPVADPAAIVARKDGVVKKLVSGVAAKMKRCGVKVISAQGKLAGRGQGGFLVETAGERFEGANVLVATGSVPLVPPIPGAREGVASGEIWLSTQALSAAAIPGRLCVIGGGVIGMEMASYFSAMGAQVTVVEMLERIGGPISPMLADALRGNYSGIDFRLGCKVTAIEPGRVVYEKGGQQEAVETDRVLMCIGRRPFAQDLGLEDMHVAMERGAVLTDETGQTSVPGIWAAGDVNGRSMLAHTAYREAECAVSTMFGQRQGVDYDAIPSVLYTVPEVATVGLTQGQAKARGHTIKSVTLPMGYAGRYLAESAGGESFLNMVVDENTRRILGVHIIGPYASEIIFGAGLMITTGLTVEALRRQVFPHPTVGEILREALFEI